MNILIVEDDELQASALKEIIINHNRNWCIFTAKNTKTALTILTDNKVDIFFLDIEFQNERDTNGLQLAESIRDMPEYRNTPILFTTAYKENIYRAINSIHCFDYITKPFKKEDIHKSLKDLSVIQNSIADSITIRDPNGVYIVIKFNDIIYLETIKHSIFFHTLNGDFNYAGKTLNNIMNELNSSFIRIHKKYIINIAFVSNYDKTNQLIKLHNTTLPVGRIYKTDIDKHF